MEYELIYVDGKRTRVSVSAVTGCRTPIWITLHRTPTRRTGCRTPTWITVCRMPTGALAVERLLGVLVVERHFDSFDMMTELDRRTQLQVQMFLNSRQSQQQQRLTIDSLQWHRIQKHFLIICGMAQNSLISF